MNSPIKRSNESLFESAVVNNSPLAIGGVGGSGTRVVAEIARELGVFMGDTINVANDNLSFIKSRDLLAETNETLRKTRIFEELNKFETMMQDDFQSQQQCTFNWGWKVPGQFHLLKYTSAYFSELKYVHVIRHGLDMAFSKNKNQLKNWGTYLGVDNRDAEDPAAALQYWISANSKAIEEGSTLLGKRFYLLNFDKLCNSPDTEIERLTKFITSSEIVDAKKQLKLELLVTPPKSLNRYKAHNYQELFTTEAIDAVRQFGFSV